MANILFDFMFNFKWWEQHRQLRVESEKEREDLEKEGAPINVFNEPGGG